MKKLLIGGIIALVLGIVSFMDAGAVHPGTTCQVGTTGSLQTSTNPDTFRAIAYTTCTLPDGLPDPPDRLALTVFWQYVDWGFNPTGASWLKAHWKDGDVYDMAGCIDCPALTSRANENVPLGPFMGINCRKALTVHQIHHHLTTTQPVYLWTSSVGVCQ